MFEIQIRPRNGKPVLALVGDLDIYSVGTACREIQTHLEAHPDLPLDLSEIQEIDSAGIQLLVWHRRQARAASQPFCLLDPSPGVEEMFRLLNVLDELGDAVSPALREPHR